MRAKFIYEKFSQDSDPISDLNIGLAASLESWIKTTDEYKRGSNSKEKDYLWICSMHNKIDYVRYLLDKGADVHAGDDYALQWASENGHDKVVKLLLNAGANVHAGDDHALRWASRYGHDKMVKLLLDAGADVHADNDLALQWASENGHDKVVKLLKDHIAKEKKIVKENLNEKFTQESDPIKDMRIGGINPAEKWKQLLIPAEKELRDYCLLVKGKRLKGNFRTEVGINAKKYNLTTGRIKQINAQFPNNASFKSIVKHFDDMFIIFIDEGNRAYYYYFRDAEKIYLED